ncbi:Nuclear transcription factor Y subunit B-2, partial [Zea mays]
MAASRVSACRRWRPTPAAGARSRTDSSLSPTSGASCAARASDKCVKERRKTINDDDIIWSLGTLGFEEYVEPLKIYLNNYRE